MASDRDKPQDDAGNNSGTLPPPGAARAPVRVPQDEGEGLLAPRVPDTLHKARVLPCHRLPVELLEAEQQTNCALRKRP